MEKEELLSKLGPKKQVDSMSDSNDQIKAILMRIKTKPTKPAKEPESQFSVSGVFKWLGLK